MDLQTFIGSIASFLDTTLLPFMLAIAGLVFFWNATRYFIIGGANAESQEKARALAFWGVIAFVFIISLWGIVNLVAGGFDFGPNDPIIPDYMESQGVNSDSNNSNIPPGSDIIETAY